MITVQTYNTLYLLEDLGDGAYLIQGHSQFCPRPIRCTLYEPPEVGGIMVFQLQEGPIEGHRIMTSEVVKVEEVRL